MLPIRESQHLHSPFQTPLMTLSLNRIYNLIWNTKIDTERLVGIENLVSLVADVLFSSADCSLWTGVENITLVLRPSPKRHLQTMRKYYIEEYVRWGTIKLYETNVTSFLVHFLMDLIAQASNIDKFLIDFWPEIRYSLNPSASHLESTRSSWLLAGMNKWFQIWGNQWVIYVCDSSQVSWIVSWRVKKFRLPHFDHEEN